MPRSGADLALLLLGGFRSLVDAAILELAAQGHKDVRPVHDFAMRAIAAGADNTSELGRRLAVSKQAAAKTVALLQERGYVTREPDPHDARRKRLQVTSRGFNVLRQGEAIFDELRKQWERQIGRAQLETLEAHLAALVGDTPGPLDTPGWMTQDVGEPGLARRRLSIHGAGLRIGGEGPRETGQTEANGKILAEEEPP
jgi:DNA-binding MarR family transcriptional regulator